MERFVKYFLQFSSILFLLSIVWSSNATINNSKPKNLNINYFPPDTIDDSTDVLPYPIIEDPTNPFGNYNNSSPLYLQNPSNIKSEIEYDPITNQYIFSQKAGSLEYRPSNYMTFEEYQEYDMDNSLKNYWKQRNGASSMETQSGIIPKIKFGGQTIENIFGSNTIDIRPQGSAELIFGVNSIKREDPALDVKQQKSTNFEFDMKIQMNVTAKIGDKIQLGLNYNTESTFDFENKMKLAYEGKEDEIIRLIEAGDVTMPLNSTLITGSQGLFGIKTQLQFGKTTVTSVFSQQKTQASTIEVSGGAQTNTFNLKADQYEENKHFFIAQYFRDHYNNALKELPIINSPINITKMEVWVTTIGAATGENRNIVALMDLGEHAPNNAVIFPQSPPGKDPNLPSNYNNSLYPNLMLNQIQIRDLNTAGNYFPSSTYASGQDYEVVESARKLSPSEYTFNSKLGFISMNTSLNSDHVLAVAYQYTVIGSDSVYQVGEFSTGGISAPKTLIVKLIKSSSLNTEIPLWKLMMKNVYAIGGYQVNPKDFRLNVLYTSNQSGVPMGFLTEGPISGQPLIRVLGCDRLNSLMDADPDGVFDFIDGAAVYGGTIQATNGRIFFPVLEPFGKDLRAKLVDPALGDKYAFDELYKLTKSGAQQFPDKNKYVLEGMFKSSSGSEISLNAMNVPQGSVKVTAGGIQLTENVDYTVDYTLGRVKIINEGILNSGTPIKISLESQSMFAIQSKTFLGTHIDYKVNKDFNIGATVLNLSERPLTQKINFGDEPINNTIWGMNADYQTESALITKLVDMLPFINTKAPSKFTIGGEFANLIPGHSKAIGAAGTSYIDDFEGTKSSMDIKNMGAWYLASTPQGQTSTNMFPEGALTDNLGFGFNRAKLNWYVIDPLFLRNNNLTPSHITANDQSNHFVREILETEVFPAKESPTGQPTNIAVLDMAFYPSERGPYNYDVNPTSFSAGLNFSTGELNSPETRWGGMMRKIETTDFEATNVEYIEFWMMDPFVYDPLHSGGELYFDLGDISEDVLKDGRKSYENGLPTSALVTNVDTTIWGRVPTVQALVNSFDNNPDARKFQDVGYDGLGDDDERTFFFNSYINTIPAGAARDNAVADPSADNYHYFRGSDYDNASTSILDRYKKYNGMEGNSSVERPDDYPISSTTIPNAEDINRDNTLSKTERYFQYKVDLKPSKMVVGENYITDVLNTSPKLANGTTGNVKWYQFKIPISSPDKIVNNIQDFKSIRFMRTFFKGFSQPIICRFATLDLVRTDWRKYLSSLLAPGEYNPDDTQSQTVFEISAVNIEENGKRSPIPYVLPPDIIRETNVASTNLQQLNEQSLVLKVCNLIDGDARGAYKTADLDIRQYKKIKMYIHAEAGKVDEALNKGDLTLFLRLGTDFNTNYYEYELPLSPTVWGTTTDKEIWPDANLIDLDLSQFQDIKLERNVAMRSGSTVTLSTPYNKMDGDRKVTVVGNPTLSGVKTIMIGLRNPKKTSVSSGDDGLAKCAEIWVNELRLTDFNEKGGWAATARITANLADLGTVALAGNISTPGFGSIEKKVNERQKENIKQYDIATNLELGKFLPPKSGIKIPMHFDFSESFSNPQYNPLNPDILLNTDLGTYSNASQKDSIKKLVQDYTMRKSINFMNVKKERTGTSTKSHIYDVENLDFTYAYTEVYHRNIDIEYDIKKTYKGAIGYNFSNNPKNFTPFGKSKFFGKYKSLRLIKDFNFFLMPKLLSFRTDVDRGYNESLMRDKSTAIVIIDPTYVKTFNWNRLYDLKWDLTQGLKVDFNASNVARIDEPSGKIDKNDPDYGNKRDTIWGNVMDFGRTTMYNQALNVNYTLPINKIPILNWISSNAKYSGEYHWTASPLSTVEKLGNTIENSNTKQINGTANMVTLYNKIPYFKKLNTKKPETNNKNNQNAPENDTIPPPPINYPKVIAEGLLKAIMGVKNVTLSYSEGNGTLLPGYKPSTVALGQDWNLMAPGTDFVFGGQRDIRGDAVFNGWLSADTMLNNPYATKHTENLTARATAEPLPNFKIEVTANRNFSKNHSEYFKADANGNFRTYSPMETGSFSISYFTWNTAWVNDNKTTYSNQNFENFKAYRYDIAMRLSEANPNSAGVIDTTGFPIGYGPTSQEVLIPAFLAAYTGKNPNTMSLDIFPKIPKPNWRITYDGLSKLAFVKKYLKTLTIGHAYRSSYNVGAYVTNVLYQQDQDGFEMTRDMIGNFIPKRDINQVSITEQFSPLINFDMVWNNSLLSKFEYKKSRDLSLSLANTQLTEISSNEIIIGLGYRIKNVVINIKSINGGRKSKLKSDLTLKADVSIRTNKTVLRKVVENIDQISTGQQIISINVSGDYKLSERFNIRLFYDEIITNPFVSSQYPNSNINAGISLRFTLAQ